jgi:hypothetical protein
VQAYIGCVSGAVMKNEYINLIKDAGFRTVKVVEETLFPIDFVADDPTVKAVIKKSNISVKKAKQFAGSVLSIKVRGIKPK